LPFNSMSLLKTDK